MKSHSTQINCLVVQKGLAKSSGHVIPLDFLCQSKQRNRLRFSGSIPISPATKQHIRRILLPAVDNITTSLGLPKSNIDIITKTPPHLTERNFVIQGHSADLPIFLGILSAATGQVILPKHAATGKICSKQGELQAIDSLETKIWAAMEHPNVETVLYTGNESIGDHHTLECLRVTSLFQAVQTAFKEKLISSLENGYFYPSPPTQNVSPLEQIAAFLSQGTPESVLERIHYWLRNSDIKTASRLVDAFTVYCQSKGAYPKRLGAGLIKIHRQVNPTLQRELAEHSLISQIQALKLAKLGTEDDFQDIYNLFKLTLGKHEISKPQPKPKPSKELDAILEHCSPEFLAKTIGIPVDEARMTFTLPSVRVRSNAQFQKTITAFYMHFHDRLEELAPTITQMQLTKNAHKWVEDGFHKQGGFDAAFQEARFPIQGGLRFIFDYLCDYEKQKRIQEHINFLLKTEVDHRGFPFKTAFIKSFLTRFHAYLPGEIQGKPPEQYANHFKAIIQSYINSQSQLIKQIKSL